MSVGAQIEDLATKVTAKVTSRGQLVTAPLEFSSPHDADIVIADTAYNLVIAEAERKFVVTDIILTGDKAISTVVDATVIIYEASSPTTTVVDNIILNTRVARSADKVLTGLNLITDGISKYINVKSTDTNVVVNLFGYYVGHHHHG